MSAFPGMDPFLEGPAFWPDFHSTFINYWREAVADALPPAYWARIGERVYLMENPPIERQLIHTDIAVTRDPLPPPSGNSPSAVATLEPVTIPHVLIEEMHETHIEILHRPDQSLVAVLELLSPANKEEPGRSVYLDKRNGLLRRPVHLVELDLLRAGQRPPHARPLPTADYYYLLSRSDDRFNCQVYSWTVRQPLPTLPVPLRPPDADLLIDLATVFATAYRRGRYREQIDPSATPPGPFRPDDREWVREQTARPTL